jgi:DNA adenine methylase
MQYLGGKHSQAKRIVETIETRTAVRQVVEPFGGAMNVAAEFARRWWQVQVSDTHPALIAMWRAAVNDGWESPATVTEEDYRAAKALPDSDPRKAAIGFGCSFGAKYFGGYARSSTYDYAGCARRSIERKAAALRAISATIECRSFFDLLIPDDGPRVLYCDPPYAGTQGYATGAFDHQEFWARCDQWAAAGHLVFVSEYSSPPHWYSILDLARQQTLRGGNLTPDLADQIRTERLFVPVT